MSERKVLNKYYPPDFDPSKIPRNKEPRNKTFTIRLMAPCNMRCTTCGEYIYKGRKFNARKEDVDDMNHLGLRIYRFYIKCTACLSEISFRTDPANTDYVLEAGATRNFEALAKAEKQAELEERAHQEELQNNPMKLLEERTEASKNEMERMEALEELQEMNKRMVKVDYDSMLSKYDKIREEEIKTQENEDETFIQSVFGKEPSGSTKVKRILDDGSSSDEERPKTKVPKPDKPTDLLGKVASSSQEKSAWEKSIGSLSGASSLKKNMLIKPKNSLVKKVEPVVAASKNDDSNQKVRKPASNPLGLIANYSDSDSNSE